MDVIRDDGLHRHLRFHKDNSYYWSWQIITTPGRLIITGDLGTFVFSRIPDMFAFFRWDAERPPRPERWIWLYTNSGYWAEKLLASDGREGLKEYNQELFQNSIEYYIEHYVDKPVESGENYDLEIEEYNELCKDLRVIPEACSSAYEVGDYFQSYWFHDGHELHDWWETFEFEDYSYHYYICINLIALSIIKYDLWREQNEQ